jgi:hypothetical protein
MSRIASHLSGYCLVSKRLERGRFRSPFEGMVEGRTHVRWRPRS